MARKTAVVDAPALPYQPRDPRRKDFRIGLIGCGGIAEWHLKAYRKAGYRVVALCDIDRQRAEQRRKQFRLDAEVYEDYHDVVERDDIDVLDITPHPDQRLPILEAAIQAGKHVLSQKPFVTDLDAGRRLVRLARRHGVKLAVNQNGRWAPHFAYLREAVAAGLIGDVLSVHMSVHWDHNWVRDTPFDKLRHVILYDFAIHWFDMLHCLTGSQQARRVYASIARTPSQTARAAMLGQALIEFPHTQATLVFDADTRFGMHDLAIITGSRGTLRSLGTEYHAPRVTLWTEAGRAVPKLRGKWFPDGFHGTMGELLCAIEEDREPQHSAADNLESLALCFAAVHSADTHKPVRPGSVRTIRP